jgi:DNA-binding MarR family transcriptional regulator
MSSVSPSRRVRSALREVSGQLVGLNREVGRRLDLRDPDFGCLNVLEQDGPMSPSTLARRTGLHPATMTGVLDRLERAGWVERERSADDRRAVVVRAAPGRAGEVYRLYGAMDAAMEDLCRGYSDEQLEVIADFLSRTAAAGAAATADLATS